MSQDDLQQLRRWRTLGARQSENVVRLAQRVLQAGGLGDEGRLDIPPAQRADG